MFYFSYLLEFGVLGWFQFLIIRNRTGINISADKYLVMLKDF